MPPNEKPPPSRTECKTDGGQAIATIYLIRHGETDWNRERRIQGQTDIPLNARGRRQAAALAQRLASLPLEMIYTSDLGRARETAALIAAAQAQAVSVVATPDLRECDYGLWEGLHREEISRRFAEDWQQWLTSEGVGRSTGGEDFFALERRVRRGFQQAMEEGKTLLISTHRGPLQAILCHILGMEAGQRRRFLVANCAVTALDCDRRGPPRLLLFNDAGHLDGL
jgi:broad specificity phosphatase PhoE